MSELRHDAIFARLGSRPIPRVARMMVVADELGINPIFCGAYREEGLSEDDSWEEWTVKRLGRHFPLLNGKKPHVYFAAVVSYNFALFRFLRKVRPALLHASDIETMPAAVLYKWLSTTRLVYNIHDNFAQRYDVPGPVSWVMNLLEGLNVLFSDVTLVPEGFRRAALPGWCQRKVQVVRNTPRDVAFAPPMQSCNEPVRVFFGGWLDWGRGLRPLLEMVEMDDQIELRIAGEGAPEIVDTIKAAKNVTYLGFLNHAQVMEETRACHFVSALYDPVRTINRYAASNKLAEALAVGRPVLLNSEMFIADTLGQSPALIVVPYSEVAGQGARLKALAENDVDYRDASGQARSLYERHFAWEPVRRKSHEILSALVKSRSC